MGISLVINVIGFSCLAYISVAALIYLIQERIIFYPVKLARDFRFRFTHPFEEIWTDVEDGKIHSLLFRAHESQGVILYFHGNADSLESWGAIAESFSHELGWDVWIFDYPGYGKSTGNIKSQAQLLKVAQALYEDVKRNYPDKKIVLFGRSIGSGMAVHLASQNKIDKLVLETPYTSLTEVASESYPFLPTAILKYKMPTKEWIKEIQVPILILHGTKDEVIPFHHAQTLAPLNPNIQLVEFEGGYHNNLSDFKYYQEALKDFLSR